MRDAPHKRILAKAALYLLVSLTAAFYLLPFLWMVGTSLKSYDQVFAIPPEWIPHPLLFSNYVELVTDLPILRYTLNTVYVTLLSLAAYIGSSAVVAFGFSYFRFPGRGMLFTVLLLTMMLPPQVTMIPQYVLFNKIGWVGSFKPLIVPALFGSAYGIFLIRQFYGTIPKEYSMAAKVDGAHEWFVLTRIYLPLSKPALATASLFFFIWTWTDFLYPLIYLNDDRTYTLALGLQQLSASRMAAWPHLMAASVLMSVPVIILFFAAQKTFIQGVNIGGVKG